MSCSRRLTDTRTEAVLWAEVGRHERFAAGTVPRTDTQNSMQGTRDAAGMLCKTQQRADWNRKRHETNLRRVERRPSLSRLGAAGCNLRNQRAFRLGSDRWC